jgi:hypothetical protein
MRTLADKQEDRASGRYASGAVDIDPSTPAGAKTMLSTLGGSKAAKIALGELRGVEGQGYLPTARISAPMRVLVALETMGLIERANDDRGRAIRFRLTELSLKQVAAKCS